MKFKALWLILPLLAVLIFIMTGCGGNSTLDVVNKFIEAEDLMFSTGDSSGLMEIEDPDIVIHMMAWPDTVGSENHIAAIEGIVAGAASPITHEWFDPIAMGDIGAVRWTETGMVGGQSVTYQGVWYLKVQDGKIIEGWLISDMLTYFLAAGIVQYAPPPGD